MIIKIEHICWAVFQIEHVRASNINVYFKLHDSLCMMISHIKILILLTFWRPQKFASSADDPCCFATIAGDNATYYTGVAEPDEYILSFNRRDNHLNISYSNNSEDNYIIIVGDWGATDINFSCAEFPYLAHAAECDRLSQARVRDKIDAFVQNQTLHGKQLLFFVALGDNFYWQGQSGTTWESQWLDIYGEYATDYYWFGVLGNHDYLQHDPHCMCPFHNFHTVINQTNPKKNETVEIPYGCNQFNIDKGGSGTGGDIREKFYMPDYSYYYTIYDLDLELIMIDTNSHHCPDDIYYDGEVEGHSWGALLSYTNCDPLGNQTTREAAGCGFLQKINDASREMMVSECCRKVFVCLCLSTWLLFLFVCVTARATCTIVLIFRKRITKNKKNKKNDKTIK